MISTGSYLPGDPITNEELGRHAGGVPEDVLEGLQVKTRHWAVDPGDGRAPRQLRHGDEGLRGGARAGRDGRGRGRHPGGLDSEPGVSPAPPRRCCRRTSAANRWRWWTSARVGQARWRRSTWPTCTLERGDYDTAVVVGSELISMLCVPIFLAGDPDKVRMRDKLGIYSFGDGAGAMVLKAAEDSEDGIFGASAIGCVGGNRKPGVQVVGGGTHAPFEKQRGAKRMMELKVHVVESGRFAPYVLTEGPEGNARALGQGRHGRHPLRDPGGERYLHDRRAGRGRPGEAEVDGARAQDLREPGDSGRTGSAAVPIALDYG